MWQCNVGLGGQPRGGPASGGGAGAPPQRHVHDSMRPSRLHRARPEKAHLILTIRFISLEILKTCGTKTGCCCGCSLPRLLRSTARGSSAPGSPVNAQRYSWNCGTISDGSTSATSSSLHTHRYRLSQVGLLCVVKPLLIAHDASKFAILANCALQDGTNRSMLQERNETDSTPEVSGSKTGDFCIVTLTMRSHLIRAKFTTATNTTWTKTRVMN